MIERAAHLKLAIDIGSDPITGSIAVAEGHPTNFCGWIELVAVIESARHDGGVADAVAVAPSSEPAAESALG